MEQERVVDLARARLVSSRVVGQLHVADPWQQTFDRRCEIPFHDLHMVDVVLEVEIVRADRIDDVDRLLRAVQVEAGNVARITGLDQQRDPGALELRRREPQVAHQRIVDLRRLDSGWA